MRSTLSQGKIPISTDSQHNLAVMGFRLHKAFPEVTKLFPLITAGIDEGRPSRDVVDDYVDQLGDRHLESLCTEVGDLFVMGWTDEFQFEMVVCAIFDLDAIQVRAESGSAWKFVATLQERLSGANLDRHVANR